MTHGSHLRSNQILCMTPSYKGYRPSVKYNYLLHYVLYFSSLMFCKVVAADVVLSSLDSLLFHSNTWGKNQLLHNFYLLLSPELLAETIVVRFIIIKHKSFGPKRMNHTDTHTINQGPLQNERYTMAIII